MASKEGVTAQARLRDLLRDHVAPVLREHGFVGSGQDFHRRYGDNWAAINFQRDKYSTKAELRFLVNLGTASTVVRVEDGFAPDEPAAEMECHWRTRLTALLPGMHDDWWSVGAAMSDADATSLGREMAGHLAGKGVPKMAEMASDEAILAVYLPGEALPGLTPAWMDVIGPILRRHGPPERLARYLAVVDANGARSASLYTMFDDFPPRLGPTGIAKRLEKLAAGRGWPRELISELGYAPPSNEVKGALRPFLDHADHHLRGFAAEALGRLGDTSVVPRLLDIVRHEPARETAVRTAFALNRLDKSLASDMRGQVRAAIGERRERAVGHDRAALSHLLRQLAADQQRT